MILTFKEWFSHFIFFLEEEMANFIFRCISLRETDPEMASVASCRHPGMPYAHKTRFPFPSKLNMILVAVVPSILNQMEFNLLQNREENCPHDHISYTLEGNGNMFL